MVEAQPVRLKLGDARKRLAHWLARGWGEIPLSSFTRRQHEVRPTNIGTTLALLASLLVNVHSCTPGSHVSGRTRPATSMSMQVQTVCHHDYRSSHTPIITSLVDSIRHGEMSVARTGRRMDAPCLIRSRGEKLPAFGNDHEQHPTHAVHVCRKCR